MLKFLKEQERRLQAARSVLVTEMDGVIASAETEQRSLTADETTKFDEKRAAILAKDKEIQDLEVRIKETEAIEGRSKIVGEQRQATDPAGGRQREPGDGVISREPTTYEPFQRHSYYLDMARSELNMGDGDGGPGAARERLQRHAKEIEVDLPKRQAQRDQAAQQELRSVDGLKARDRESVFEKRVNPNRTDGQGGNFVPPLWLIDEYIDLPRFGRTVANSVRNLTLPSGTDSINLPKIATGTTTAAQTADAAAVSSTDLTDTSVNAPVRTIAGQQDIAIQLLDQSPISFDEIVFADLIADYNLKLDVQCINGSGASGQVTGILQTSGINAVTYTDATPTIAELWVPLLQAVSQVAKNRKLPPLAVFTIPSMWYWALSQLDGVNGRPFIAQTADVAFNPMALQTGADSSEGYVGKWNFGMPQLNDGNIPSNLGGGTNETRVIVARTSDIYLWEGSMRSRVMAEVLSNTLQVRLQVYNYVAFMANRRPEAISVISGTGLIPPAGF